MNLGMETEAVEYKKSTGEMREGMESIASILNKHGHGTFYFGVRNDGEVNNIRRAFIIDGSSLHRKEVPEIPISAIRKLSSMPSVIEIILISVLYR